MFRLKSKDDAWFCNASSGFAFLCALIAYWITADSSVSYWDCPEYVTTASRLEVGHPPGNPIWTLAMRVATIPFEPVHHAYIINLCSGLFMALATLFLARIIFIGALWLFRNTSIRRIIPEDGQRRIVAAVIAAGGALCFAFCDSAWFSAVEAEVYAMSAFLTSLSIWLMVVWARCSDPSKRIRLLILTAYVTGLSLGVHQLNLLVIPVMALIFVFRRHPGHATWRGWLAILLAFIAVGAILLGIMPGTVQLCALGELFAVNTLHLPFFWGAIATIVLLLSAICVAAVISFRLRKTAMGTLFWMLGFIILGYSSFALILIRGVASPPMNEAAPTDIFSLQRYIAREQYGAKPLFYGATPYSKPMFVESWPEGSDRPAYRRYVLKDKGPRYFMALPDARIYQRSGFMTPKDSVDNQKAIGRNGDAYILADHGFSRVTTPELDMWFPRITGNSPDLLESYEAWAGMDRLSMDHVAVSEAIDTLGNPVAKMNADGERGKPVSHRPTYLHNLRLLMSYQIGYMYFRYLMWNFVGRQNDIASTGEIDHGNFITGFTTIDNAMLGPTEKFPASAYKDNPGHNVYYGIPFILAIMGMIFLMSKGREGRRAMAVVTLFFLMTGVAIVVYLNQTPGEPRERDYSFLGSFMAFSIWIAVGMAVPTLAALKFVKNRIVGYCLLAVISAGTPILMAAENFDDHDRRGRFETAEFASNILSSLPDGIIFTQGDNFTFPLWYAQETEGKGSGHAVIDVSYLATPEYVANLMRQGDGKIRFTATPADIAFGAYSFTKIDRTDTVRVPLIDALKELYAQKEGAPTIRHSRVWIPGNSGDTIRINISDLASGGNLPFKQLMLLDIIASNSVGPDAKPLHFLTSLSTGFYSPLRGHTFPSAFAETFHSTTDSVSRIRLLDKQLNSLNASFARHPRLPRYLEPVVADQHRRQRGAMVRTGKIFLEAGQPATARKWLDLAAKAHPYSEIPAASFTLADTTFHEGIEFVNVYLDVIDQSGNANDTAAIGQLAEIVKAMQEDAKGWRLYYANLPEWRRVAVSNESRRRILTIPALDSLAVRINHRRNIH